MVSTLLVLISTLLILIFLFLPFAGSDFHFANVPDLYVPVLRNNNQRRCQPVDGLNLLLVIKLANAPSLDLNQLLYVVSIDLLFLNLVFF